MKVTQKMRIREVHTFERCRKGSSPTSVIIVNKCSMADEKAMISNDTIEFNSLPQTGREWP